LPVGKAKMVRIGLARTLVVLAVVIACAVLVQASRRGGAVLADGHERTIAPVADAASRPPAVRDPTWHKSWWIDKAARLLRGGEGLGPEDDLQALLALPKEEIVRRFMQDARFGDTILDFNLFFLGFKSDVLKADGIYDRTVFDFPNAVTAAQALLRGGDYHKLFDFEGSFFMAPLRTEPLGDPPQPGDEGLSAPQLRAKAIGEAREAFEYVLEFATAKPAPSAAALCGKVAELAESASALTAKLYRAFDDAEIFALIRGEVLTRPLHVLGQVVEKECGGKTPPAAARERVTEALRRALQQVDRAFAEMAKFEPAIYQPRTVLDFKPYDLAAFPTKQRWLSFGFEQGIALGNSSTNFNRKRSAYILKRFFCDDLIPVGFENPIEHVSGAHGSQTTCFACHHKLDPMAGFFRSYGAFFFNYAQEPEIIFDDLASKDRKLYEAVWKAARKAAPAWNVGYIRSSRYQSSNNYGSTMADLSRIARAAPEVKRCLMRRLFEYVVAEHQTIDSGYLDHLTKQFEAETARSSSSAMKNAIVRVLLSKAYDEPDADPKRCYDLAPGETNRTGPPCRVAAILNKNCSQCHSTGAAQENAARFDVGAWILAPGGKERAFRHVDASSVQLTAQESLSRLIERLSTHDQSQRMPKGRVMPSDERQELFLWAQEELARISKQAGP